MCVSAPHDVFCVFEFVGKGASALADVCEMDGAQLIFIGLWYFYNLSVSLFCNHKLLRLIVSVTVAIVTVS